MERRRRNHNNNEDIRPQQFPSPMTLYVAGCVVITSGMLYWISNPAVVAPAIDTRRWWGEGAPRDMDTSVRPFRARFTDEMILDLRRRLTNRIPLTPPLEGINSEYGINTNYLGRMLDYWQHKYNFSEREEAINEFPRYKTNIQGLDISFIHVQPNTMKTRGMRVLPLMLVHGWPSSSREFLDILSYLTTPRRDRDYVFEVVCPDLPGFGFSQATTKTGLNTLQMSIIMRNLMIRLGHRQYYLQGGDWGSSVVANLAILFPEEVIGIHVNLAHAELPISYAKLIVGSIFPKMAAGKYADRIYPLKKYSSYVLRETGYFHIQATKPDTIGVALSDSPSGLAAYILEKIGVLTDKDALDQEDGGIGDAYSPDELLDMITIMWANRCITTSMRIYAECTGPMREPNSWTTVKMPIRVPAAVINFKNEIFYQPDWILKDRYPLLVRSTTHDFGGHFPAMELPELFASDIWDAVHNITQYHKLRSNSMFFFI